MDEKEFETYLKKNYRSTSSFLCGISLAVIDILTLLLCLALGFFIVNLFSYRDINFKSFINYGIFFPFIFVLFGFFRLYPGLSISPAEEMRRFSGATFISFFLILMLIVFSKGAGFNFMEGIVLGSRTLQLIFAFGIAFFLSAILLTANRELAKLFFSKFKWWGVPAIIYCDKMNCSQLADTLIKKKYLGYHPCAFICSNYTARTPKDYRGIPVFSSKNKDIIKKIHQLNVKTAILYDYKGDITEPMTTYRYTIAISSKQTSFTTTQQIKELSGLIGFASTHNLRFASNLVIKRLTDILIITICLPLLIPLFLILAIGVKVTSKGPVFYGHPRIGKNGKKFKCIKFRSMDINSQAMLEDILKNDPVRRAEWEKDRKFTDDPRVTKFGKFLRKTSLDELPQLLNILAGQMSFVGPRPVTAEETEKYGDHKNLVLSVLPGLSGMWQVSGRSETSYEERIFYDSYYIQNWSIWLDFWIIIKTIWVVLRRKGAY